MSLPRIGLGTDLHRLVPGRPCILGGLELDCPVGPQGHSDGDAILHALCDALLGAAGLEDLGTLFPDSDPAHAARPSSGFLEEALRRIRALDLEPASVDLVVHCDRPRIGPHRSALRNHLADLLGMPVDRVNLKGKSLENTQGDQETVSVHCVCLLIQK